jgi:hypothetical protein
MKRILFTSVLALMIPFMSFAQGCMEGGEDEGVKLAGYVQGQFWGEEDADGFNTTFGFERARIGVLGSIPYDFSYYAFAELSPFKSENPHLLDAFITYNRWAPFARISLGQFKAPMGMELNTACHKLHTVKRSRATNALTAPDRDLGLMISGGTDTTLIQYSIAFLNGTGRGIEDDNSFKDIAGRITFHPFDFLRVGGSFRYGKHPASISEATEDDKRTRIAGEIQLEYKGFLLQGEYIYGKDEGSVTSGGGGCGEPVTIVPGSAEKSGLFVQAMYMTPWKLQPVIKFDQYDADIDADFDQISTTTFGVNYFFNDWTRLQVNYLYTADELSPTRNDLPNDEFYVQLQVVF